MEDKQIPKFTKEEYLFTPKPYEWLNSYSGNPFELMQMTERLSRQAYLVGVRNLKTLFREYQKSLDVPNKNIIMNSTNFDGQELQLDCGSWFCDEYGVTCVDRTGTEIIACMHPIMPVQRLVDVDTGLEKMQIAFKKGTQWRKIIVDKKTLASNNSITSLADYGIAVTSENSRALVKFLSEIENMNYEKIPKLDSIGRMGWIKEYGFSPYVKDLVYDGDLKYKHFFETVKSNGNYEKWLEVAKYVRSSDSIPARIVLAASFASVLVDPLDALPFFVHLWAASGSGTGKTVTAMLAGSVWGNPRMGEYVHTCRDTDVGQELSAAFLNSLPLILDELQTIKDKKNFDKMIYNLTEGVGKVRGAKSGGLQKVGTWRNCMITTGEMPIISGNSGGGAVNRVIDIECTEKLFDDPLHILNIINNNYGFAGKEFVEYASKSEVMDKIRIKQKEYMQILQQSESTDKQSVSASLILVADFFATELIFKDGNNLTVEDIKPFLSTKTDVSQELRAYEYIMDVVAMNESKFLSMSHDGTERWGVIDDENIYIVTAKFNEILANGGFNSTALLSWLKKNELITYDKGRKDKVKKISGICRRCICLKQQIIDTFIEEISDISDEENPFSPTQEVLALN